MSNQTGTIVICAPVLPDTPGATPRMEQQFGTSVEFVSPWNVLWAA